MSLNLNSLKGPASDNQDLLRVANSSANGVAPLDPTPGKRAHTKAFEPHQNGKAATSLQRGRIKRDGLAKGSRAPSFSLPDIRKHTCFSTDGLRCNRFLLVFSDVKCGPCNELLPQLEALHRRTPDINVLMISRGSLEENRSKAENSGLTFPVVLQARWEISLLYKIFMTPVAFLIDPEGLIESDVAIGPKAILGLLKAAAIRRLLSD